MLLSGAFSESAASEALDPNSSEQVNAKKVNPTNRLLRADEKGMRIFDNQ
jgi:hypothetical protein